MYHELQAHYVIICVKLSCNDLMKNEKLPKYMKVERKKKFEKTQKENSQN